MGTKLKPSAFDCYDKAEPDEPMFVLLARDPLAPILVRLWADLREHASGNPSKVAEARSCVFDMEIWQERKRQERRAGLLGDPEGPQLQEKAKTYTRIGDDGDAHR